ncbi:MAG: heavy metal-responsive transcriptional regulator [Deltaproteobacteria bacterium]|nr:heavy metal-responsive transcriptional regulator [Deltaproteobacteria bacterium]
MATKFIGELAAELGLNPRTLRYYEARGVLPPAARTLSGYRVYGEETAQRLSFVSKVKSLGLTLKEIEQILALRDSGEPPCPSVQQMLQEHIERTDRQIAQLRALKADLRTLLNGWLPVSQRNGKATPGAICPRIEAYSTPQRKHNATKKGGEKQ